MNLRWKVYEMRNITRKLMIEENDLLSKIVYINYRLTVLNAGLKTKG